jgi:hypothetical protein
VGSELCISYWAGGGASFRVFLPAGPAPAGGGLDDEEREEDEEVLHGAGTDSFADAG